MPQTKNEGQIHKERRKSMQASYISQHFHIGPDDPEPPENEILATGPNDDDPPER